MSNCFCGHSFADHQPNQQTGCQQEKCKCRTLNPATTQFTLNPVKSDHEKQNVLAAGYIPQTRTLLIQFNSKKIYWYNEVSATDYSLFAKTFDDPEQSTGKYFRKHFLTSEHFGLFVPEEVKSADQQ